MPVVIIVYHNNRSEETRSKTGNRLESEFHIFGGLAGFNAKTAFERFGNFGTALYVTGSTATTPYNVSAVRLKVELLVKRSYTVNLAGWD